MLVVMIRRLHDRNKSGWWILLCLIPIVQIFMAFYLLFARGCNRANRFGHPRPSAFIEKLLAWLMIITFVIGLFASTSIVSFMMGAGEIDSPNTVIQRGTEYF
jgi:Na+/H+ antiporter NhaC